MDFYFRVGRRDHITTIWDVLRRKGLDIEKEKYGDTEVVLLKLGGKRFIVDLTLSDRSSTYPHPTYVMFEGEYKVKLYGW